MPKLERTFNGALARIQDNPPGMECCQSGVHDQTLQKMCQVCRDAGETAAADSMNFLLLEYQQPHPAPFNVVLRDIDSLRQGCQCLRHSTSCPPHPQRQLQKLRRINTMALLDRESDSRWFIELKAAHRQSFPNPSLCSTFATRSFDQQNPSSKSRDLQKGRENSGSRCNEPHRVDFNK